MVVELSRRNRDHVEVEVIRERNVRAGAQRESGSGNGNGKQRGLYGVHRGGTVGRNPSNGQLVSYALPVA